MKHGLCVSLCIVMLSYCGPGRDEVDRIVQDGVEIVSNHMEPYRIGGVSSFALEENFRIDTEENEIVDLGIADILGFEVDSEGNIFVLSTYKGGGDFIYKFDSGGEFIKSFGPQGEGPGEFQNPPHIALDSEDNILIIDWGRPMLNQYDKTGAFIKGSILTGGERKVTPGPGSKMLFLVHSTDPETGKRLFSLKLMNSDLEEVRQIDQLGYSLMVSPGKLRATEPLLCWSASRDRIYVAKEDRGYEIWVYDADGKLIRKIKKEYTPVPVSKSYREKILKKFPPPARDRAFFPKSHPPFQSITASDDGKLLVVTFENGPAPGEYLFDIFDEEGVFIGRKSLSAWIWESHLWARIIGDKFYCLQEKESGYRALKVCDMKWERGTERAGRNPCSLFIP